MDYRAMAPTITKKTVRHPLWKGEPNETRREYGEYMTVFTGEAGSAEIITIHKKIAGRGNEIFTHYRVEFRDVNDILWTPKIRIFHTMEEAERYGERLLKA